MIVLVTFIGAGLLLAVLWFAASAFPSRIRKGFGSAPESGSGAASGGGNYGSLEPLDGSSSDGGGD